MTTTGVDVRPVRYNEVVIDALGSLDEVPWPHLHHAFGVATDVPGQLRALRAGDPATRDWAGFELLGNVYHQGSRWQASRYVVPFLVAMVDDPATPDRSQVARILRAVALGDRNDRDLPFASAVAFEAADTVTEEQEARSIAALYDSETGWDSTDAMDEADRVARKWERDAFQAAERHTARFARWVADPDPELAARAAGLLAWFPLFPAGLVALIAMSPDPARWAARASANLTLAHLARDAPGITEGLRAQLHAVPPPVRLTAAIALAYRLGDALPPAALDVLVAARHDAADDDVVPPWDRPLTGFTALALRRVGLG